jgi:hypothetical protein
MGVKLWSDERSLTMLGNKVLEVISGPKAGAVRGRWRKIHDQGLHNIY